MGQANFCEQCEISIGGNICNQCGELLVTDISTATQNVEPIRSPGDNQSVLLKRYKISERKKILPFPGFKLYSNKNNGNGWEIVEEQQEIEGKNSWLKWLFGKENSGFVYYLNTLTLPIKFEWLVPFNGEKYRVNTLIEIKIKYPEFFITEHQGISTLLLDELASSIEGSAKERLKNVLAALDAENIDFAKCQTDIHAKCQNIIGDKGIDITSVTMSGEVEVDPVLQALDKAKTKATHQRELLSHQSTEENLTEQHLHDKNTETSLRKSDNELKLELAEIDKKKAIRIQKAQAEVEALEEEWLVKDKSIDISTKAGVAQQESETKVAVSGIQGQVKLVKENLILDQAKNSREKVNVEHAFDLGKKAKEYFGQKDGEPSVNDTETTPENKQDRPIKEQVLNFWKPSYSKESVSQVKGFGNYFWDSICLASPVVKNLILNEKLHYIRYEDNYCQDLRTIINLHQILKEVRKLGCYSSFTETHIVFGAGKEPEQFAGINNFVADARDELFRQLLKNQGDHIAVSSKDYVHDREMKLVFSNGAEVKMTFSYGLAYWRVGYFPPEIKQLFEQPIEVVKGELVTSLKALLYPKVYCRDNVKDTSVTIESWIPKT